MIEKSNKRKYSIEILAVSPQKIQTFHFAVDNCLAVPFSRSKSPYALFDNLILYNFRFVLNGNHMVYAFN